MRTPGKRAGTFTTKVTPWGASTNQILAPREMLLAETVTTVVMEAISDYWKPFYYRSSRLHLPHAPGANRFDHRLDRSAHRPDRGGDGAFRVARNFLNTIPDVNTITADVIVAETGADMDRFPTLGNLCSWSGVTPGSNESTGRIKSTRPRPENRYLKRAFGQSALMIARQQETDLGSCGTCTECGGWAGRMGPSTWAWSTGFSSPS